MNEIEQYNDLIEQVKECLSIYRQNIYEQYAASLWHSGEIINHHPLGKKSEAIKTLAEATSMSPRYFYYSIKVYEEFPYPTWEEAVPDMMKRTERTVITEKSLIALVEGKKEREIKTRNLQTKFKDAVSLDLKTLLEYVQDEKVKYIKLYFEDGDEITEQLYKKI